ncbi:hypothetical protein QYM36_010027 [Artemia franciscana]|uniref:Uncharacterized protein n=1 Tax=Artemia franciscana TaxID=6661 RepID=A0AA88HWC3_ARTSF|nr:hypothetical protein QYM36_010027 [Artemia franciscana]
MCHGLTKRLQWFADHRIVLKLSKTHFTLVSRLYHGFPSLYQIFVNFNRELITITREESCKYLGLIFEENVSWKLHLDRIRTQLGRNVVSGI